MNTVDSLDPIAGRGLADFDAMVTRQWHALSGPGVWFDGAEQLEIAAEARGAMAGRPSGERLDRAVSDATRRVAAEAWTIRPADIAGWIEAGVRVEAYVELLGIVARIAAIDTTMFGLGLDERPLPTPRDGAPSNQTVEEARPDKGWVPTVGEAHPLTALSAVPGAVDLQFDVHGTLYLSLDQMNDPHASRDGVTRPQIELAAARTSYLNECFF